jgi:hypothetical protein
MEEKRRRGRPRKELNVEQQIEQVDNLSFTDSEEENPMTKPTPEIENYNPFSENVVEREYARPAIAEGVVTDLEEPVFHQASFDEIRRESQAENSQMSQQADVDATKVDYQRVVQSDPLTNVNTSYNALEDKEKEAASEALVDTVLDLYEQAHKWGSHFVKYDEGKLQEKIMGDEIDIQRAIPIDAEGNVVSIVDFVQTFNAQVDDAFAPDPSFRKKVRKPMINIFKKRGWGLTDEQQVLFAFGQDITAKVIIGYNMNKQMKGMINMLSAEYMASKGAKTSSKGSGGGSGSNGGNGGSTPPNYTPPRTPSGTPIEPEVVSDERLAQEERHRKIVEERMRKAREAESLQRAQEEQTVSSYKIKEQVVEEADLNDLDFSELDVENEVEKVVEEPQHTEKFNIQFDENPLRENVSREIPDATVIETFTKGEEI